MWTNKQWEFIDKSTKTYNGKIGATRSGKTYLDLALMIAKRTRELKGLDGLYVIMGVTSDTIERNLLAPMRDIWGDELVGVIRKKSVVQLFGETYHVVGHEKISAVRRIQGASIKYCYIDEIVNMNRETFDMLHSRLDQDHSVCDFTGNPDNPNHFIYKWFTNDKNKEDIFMQTYTLDDNTYLDDKVRERIKRQYLGTVSYDRYVNGKWVVAEGSIYPMLRRDTHVVNFEDIKDDIKTVHIGVDFGGNKSKTTFQCTGISALGRNIKFVATIKERKFEEEKDMNYMQDQFLKFIEDVEDLGYPIREIRADSADQIAIKSLQNHIKKHGKNYLIMNSVKGAILNRIRFYQRLFNTNRYFIVDDCKLTIEAFENAVWSDKVDKDGKDIRLDDGTTNIDTLDAQEYSTETLMKLMLKE